MTPVPLLPLPGTPQAPDPLGGFRGLQPTPAAVTPGPAGVSRLPDIQYTELFQDDIVDFAGQFLQPQTAPDGWRAISIHSQQLINLPFGYVQDLTFSARVTLSSGAFQVSVRQSGAGEYRAMADTSGLVVLQRAGQTLATAQLPASHRFEQGVLLTMIAAGPRITVHAGADVLIAYDDPQPLPYGVISFGGMDFAPTRGWLSELTLSANVARDLETGAALIETLATGRETRQNQPLPDPGRIYFTRTSNGVSAIWSVKPDGSDSRVVVENATQGDISPDGRRLAFISNRDGAFRLWVKLAEGVLFQLSKEASPVTHQNPSWSYDNVRVAFIRDGSSSGEGTSIWIHDMRRATTSLYPTNEPIHPARIDWSPDSDAIAYVDRPLTAAYELAPDGTSRLISNVIPNVFFIRAITYGLTSETAFVVHQNNPLNIELYHLSRIDLSSTPVATHITELRDEFNAVLTTPEDIAISPDGTTIAVQFHKSLPGDLHTNKIRLFSAAGTLLPQSISDAAASISWSGSAEFTETFERCVSIPVPTQGVALRPDLTQTPPAIGTPLPPDTRIEFTGRVIDQAMTPWLEVNAVMPQYATTPTPEATYATPYWVSAGAFSVDGVYLDPCDDHPLINDPAAGNASDSYYLPLLQQPERTLTPTYTPTQSPICIGITTLSQPANVRALPTTSSASLGTVEDNQEFQVTGKTDGQDADGYYWYRIIFNGQDGWLRDDLIDVDEQQWACASLTSFNPTGTPNATYTPSPTIQPSRTPTYGTTPTRIPRLVPTQAQPLHAIAERVGLPLPFDILPVTDILVAANGFGPNKYSYSGESGACYIGPNTPTPEPTLDLCQYRGTSRIHPGLDYFTDPERGAVIALCDGVIVAGPAALNGGTALTTAGDGLSLRCFAVEPTDPDGDGSRNLSNIIVVYNHLTLAPGVEKNSYQVIKKGDVLGISNEYFTQAGLRVPSHLDLQLYLASDFRTADRYPVNPLLMFATQVPRPEMAYPVNVPFAEHEQFDEWWLQAYRGSANFWANISLDTLFIRDIAALISTEFLVPYVGPNCPELSAVTTDFGLSSPIAALRCTPMDHDSGPQQ